VEPFIMQSRLLAVFLALGASLFSQSIVVPNANESVRGTAQLNSIIRNAGNPRTYQYGINATELTGIPVGSVITGVSLRFQVFSGNSASWPPASITWNNYDIWVGPAIPTATWGASFFANFVGSPQQVRSGPMTLDAGVFTNINPTAPTPNPWAEFYFDFQNPYQWLGGDLAFLFSHPGSLDPGIAQYPETVASNAGTHGAARVQSIYPAGTASAATTYYVVRVHYGYGNGCLGGSGTPPVLVQSGNTSGGLGGTILFQIGNAPANAQVLFAIGFNQISVPLGNGCTLLNSLDFLFPMVTDANGRSVLPIFIPPSVAISALVQAGVGDPLAPGGLTLTNGVMPSAF
jgi:hypothetical protein